MVRYYTPKAGRYKGQRVPTLNLYTAEQIDSFVQRSVVLFEGYVVIACVLYVTPCEVTLR